MSHPVADVFKEELEERLFNHFHVFKEGPCHEVDWSADDHELFAHNYLSWSKFWKDSFVKLIACTITKSFSTNNKGFSTNNKGLENCI